MKASKINHELAENSTVARRTKLKLKPETPAGPQINSEQPQLQLFPPEYCELQQSAL